jgi:quercetin 2,3-dioxygenase
MITLRKSADRGHADHGWLKSFHSFSFADYHDPAHMGVGNLRVINEDRIAPGTGFGTHGHRDMEIVSYVLDGALAHKDSMGNGTAGGARPRRDPPRRRAAHERRHRRDAQRVQPRQDATTHFLQIWILPASAASRRATSRSTSTPPASAAGCALVASPDGATAR